MVGNIFWHSFWHIKKTAECLSQAVVRCFRYTVVPRRGLEPPHLAAHGPEPCASTNSAIWALLRARNLIVIGFCVNEKQEKEYP